MVKVTYYKVTYVHEETMFLTEPIIKDDWNRFVLHVRPYIGEVVELFFPQPRGYPVGEAAGERDNYSSDDNKSLFLVLTMTGVLKISTTMTCVREETMFFAEPVIEEAMNTSVLHVCPFIGEVVERFSPPPWV